jgi:hypothetical protein
MDESQRPSDPASGAGDDSVGQGTTPPADPILLAPDQRLIPTQEIERALGKTIAEALDLPGWDQKGGVEPLLRQVPDFVRYSMREERRMHGLVRVKILDKLKSFPDAPTVAGVYRVSKDHLRAALRNHLLPGAVSAVHGACAGHDGLAATLISIGVSLVRYDGEQRSWRTTFLRHDYNLTAGEPVEDLRKFLNRRHRQKSTDSAVGRSQLTYLLRRGFMAAAERKALLQTARSPWRLGRGVPAPLELLTGAGSMALIDHILPVLDQLLLQEHGWLFLPSPAASPALGTLADALEDGQLGIFVKGKATLEDILDRGHFETGYRNRVRSFVETLGETMVIGGFRATRHAPGQLFIAHKDDALTAGVIAMADASLQPHRGVPLLLDLAGLSAKVGLGIEAFHGVIEAAYAQAGAAGWFTPERVFTASETI